MNGIKYMLLGISIMILGHGIIYIIPLPYVFDLVGFLVVIYGFYNISDTTSQYDKKIIAFITPCKTAPMVSAKRLHTLHENFDSTDNNEVIYDIDIQCSIHILTDESNHNYKKVSYSEWLHSFNGWNLYCVGFKHDAVVYLEQISEQHLSTILEK